MINGENVNDKLHEPNEMNESHAANIWRPKPIVYRPTSKAL